MTERRGRRGLRGDQDGKIPFRDRRLGEGEGEAIPRPSPVAGSPSPLSLKYN